jgi:hypothetical protein
VAAPSARGNPVTVCVVYTISAVGMPMSLWLNVDSQSQHSPESASRLHSVDSCPSAAAALYLFLNFILESCLTRLRHTAAMSKKRFR